MATSIGGYILKRSEPLKRLHGTFHELVHEPTGARHIHIEVDDPSKCFVVLLPTVPKDSTGVAHILEHVVLAGSQRFPVKDPFFSMTTRSLNDFMNASTSMDATLYYYSTRNMKDFHNLLDVYLDAVFFPLIEELSFSQEGHRLEFEKGDDPGSGLRFKGVVFNEMKGSLASPPRVVFDTIYRALFPDLTYANDSGGDPARIPDLTWQGLKDFHATHYHPSNAYFYTYGDLDLPGVLGRVESGVLSRFERITPDVDIGDQTRFPAPVELRTSYPLGREEDPARRSQVLVAWLGPQAADSFEVLAFNVLEEVLLGNAASPLRKALIDSKLGAALADGSGFRENSRQAVFCAGLKDVDEADAGKVESLILDTLERLASEGIDPGLVDGAVHQLEIDSREISNASFPHAFKVFAWLASGWVYGGDPYRSLQLDDDLARLESERRAGPFFEELIRGRLLDNTHRARLVVVPDQELEERQEAAERERLADIEAGLTDEQKRAVVERARELASLQESKQDVSVLPTLDLADVSLTQEDAQHTIERIGSARAGLFSQPTNGLTYIDARADFSAVPDRLKDRLALFAYALPRMGAGADDYLKMASRIETYTGGIEAAVSVRPPASGGPKPHEWMIVRGKAISRNNAPFVEIVRDLLASVRFDPERLEQVIAEYRTRMETQVVQAGMVFAASLAASKVSPSGMLEERLGGLTQLRLLREMSELGASRLGDVIADLDALRDHVFRGPGLQICVTSEEEDLDGLRGMVAETVAALPGDAASPDGGSAPAPEQIHEARTTSVPVAYTAKVVPTVACDHPDAPVLTVLGPFMRANYLHRVIREQGGAYGSHASQDREKGFFQFWSYRDPNIARTFDAFGGAVRNVLDERLETEDVKEAILAACKAVDPLLSPDTKGRLRFFDDLAGYTLDVKERFKRRLLEVSEDDLKRVARDYLSGDGASMAVIASPEMAEDANRAMGGVLRVSPV